MFLSTESPPVSRISSRAAKAAEEKFDLILFQSVTVSMDTRWTSSLAAVAEFITALPSQRQRELPYAAFPWESSRVVTPVTNCNEFERGHVTQGHVFHSHSGHRCSRGSGGFRFNICREDRALLTGLCYFDTRFGDSNGQTTTSAQSSSMLITGHLASLRTLVSEPLKRQKTPLVPQTSRRML